MQDRPPAIIRCGNCASGNCSLSQLSLIDNNSRRLSMLFVNVCLSHAQGGRNKIILGEARKFFLVKRQIFWIFYCKKRFHCLKCEARASVFHWFRPPCACNWIIFFQSLPFPLFTSQRPAGRLTQIKECVSSQSLMEAITTANLGKRGSKKWKVLLTSNL